MNLPDPPPLFRQPSPAERPWWWRLEDSAGNEVELSGPAAEEYGGRRFASQADAESWIGETWSALAEEGVAAVTLFDVDREVYGPMSLSA
ncbi:hypothetical protein MF406_18190 (plasmid) [Georgenia sp. TF02-10]|uniref:hypothetical protein n=1 Tax=Georgenia sp. TF02-10 TaxID=2917725 RepID=UPI001FA80F93|nr:hypothetical protein [Georgenia sp. TF02-10]UNX56579.1 hypothetical protein MF406_18190 [Georgenia sp. TF02-10]